MGVKLKNKKVVVFVVLLVIALVGFIGFRLTAGSPQDNAADIPVKTVLVKTGTVNSSFLATGIIVSAKQVNLNFDNSGTLDDLNVALNEKVEEDQDLADLDPTNENIAIETLESPIDGTIIHIGATEGEIVSSTSAGSATSSSAGTIDTSGFMTVADLSNLQIKMSIDQADIQKVSKGQKVKIKLDAFDDKEFSGEVVSINPVPTNDQNVITYTAYASVDKSKTALRLGMSADVELEYGKKENVVLVPSDAIRNVDGRKIVMTMVGSRPRSVEVKVGQSDDQNTEIMSGLSAGDKIISGRLNFRQGQSGAGNAGGGLFGGGPGGSQGGGPSGGR